MNIVVLSGNLTRDPEYSTTQNGTAVCKFTLAVKRKYKDKVSGAYQSDFVQIVCWKWNADNAYKYLRKGKNCRVHGQLSTRSYDAQDGTKRYVTEVVAESLEFDPGQAQGYSAEDHQTQSGAFTPTGAQRGGFDDEDDELPF